LYRLQVFRNTGRNQGAEGWTPPPLRILGELSPHVVLIDIIAIIFLG